MLSRLRAGREGRNRSSAGSALANSSLSPLAHLPNEIRVRSPSVSCEHAANFLHGAGARQRQHEQNASLLRIEVVGANHACLVEISAQRHAATAGPAPLYAEDAAIARLLHRRPLPA